MNSKYLIVVVLTIFLLGISGGAVSADTAPEKLSSAEYEKRRSQILDFFSIRQTRSEIIATTKTRSGQIIDWIKPESQVAGGKFVQKGIVTLAIQPVNVTESMVHLSANFIVVVLENDVVL